MSIEFIAGPPLGLALQMLHEAIKRAKDGSKTTKRILERLNATIVRIAPLVVQVDKLSERVEDSLRKVVVDLKDLLEKATSLVKDYAELRRRNLLTKYRYKRNFQELEASLKWMVDVDVQLDQWADIKELMAKLSEMNIKLDKATCVPTESHCFKSISSVKSQSSNQTILEATHRSSKGNEETSNDGSEPKIDIHLRWCSRKQNKGREVRFFVK